MQKETLPSAFTWIRGRRNLWRITGDGLAEIAYGRGSAPALEPVKHGLYRPLEETPRLYEECAALGGEAFRAGKRISNEVDKRVPAWTEAEGERRKPLAAPDPFLCADMDSAIRQKVLTFVQSYGALHYRPERWWVADFLREAYELYRAMELAREVHDWEVWGDTHDSELRAKRKQLGRMLNARLGGVQLLEVIDEESGRLRPAFSCEDLLSAMWLQLYEGVNGSRSWRLCRGCDRLFSTTDPRQRYHDVACRNRSHARRYGRKEKEGNDVEERK